MKLVRVDTQTYVNVGEGNITTVVAAMDGEHCSINFASGKYSVVRGNLETVVQRLSGRAAWGADQ